MVLLPSEQLFHHVATPSNLTQILSTFCGANIDETVLKVTQLRLAGNTYAAQQDFRLALDCYTAALALGPSSGAHLLYSNRSTVNLQAGNKEAALEDARRAVELAPVGFHTATIRLIDCLYALQQYEEAAQVAREGAVRDSSFQFRPEYRVIKKALQGVGQSL